ncbi:hypothetical protein C8R46DRAFT_1222568 [Mycena filopes]|nr:hypothetical protein C8R46DRAFT_1222568 [Mycena filopes]
MNAPGNKEGFSLDGLHCLENCKHVTDHVVPPQQWWLKGKHSIGMGQELPKVAIIPAEGNPLERGYQRLPDAVLDEPTVSLCASLMQVMWDHARQKGKKLTALPTIWIKYRPAICVVIVTGFSDRPAPGVPYLDLARGPDASQFLLHYASHAQPFRNSLALLVKALAEDRDAAAIRARIQLYITLGLRRFEIESLVPFGLDESFEELHALSFYFTREAIADVVSKTTNEEDSSARIEKWFAGRVQTAGFDVERALRTSAKCFPVGRAGAGFTSSTISSEYDLAPTRA